MIEVSRATVKVGNKYTSIITYNWPDTKGKISNDLIRNAFPDADLGDCIEFGPYVARIVGRDYANNTWEVVKCDIPGDIIAALHPLRIAFHVLLCRIILTLEVWGLAEIPGGKLPTWGDVGRRVL